MASIRNLGNCPCPRCLLPLGCVHNLGKARDTMQRVSMARVDSNQSRSKILTARKLIYEKNIPVNGASIERLLRETSLVPSMVCITKFCHNLNQQLTICC